MGGTVSLSVQKANLYYHLARLHVARKDNIGAIQILQEYLRETRIIESAMVTNDRKIRAEYSRLLSEGEMDIRYLQGN